MTTAKLKLCVHQLEQIQKLNDAADIASENGVPGMILAQIRKNGDVEAFFVDQETSVNIIAAKAGLSKCSKPVREKILSQKRELK